MLLTEENFTNNNKNNLSSFEFMNSVGVIFRNDIIVHAYDSMILIKVNDLRRVTFSKRRNFILNVLSIVATMISIYGYFYFKDLNSARIYVLFFAIIFFLFSLIYSNYEYRLVLLQKHDFTEIKLDKRLKEEAKVFTQKINNKLSKSVE